MTEIALVEVTVHITAAPQDGRVLLRIEPSGWERYGMPWATVRKLRQLRRLLSGMLRRSANEIGPDVPAGCLGG
jgi:hypothetical protein